MILLEKILTYLSPLLALVGTYLIILAWQKQHEIQHTLQKGLSTMGTVIELRTEENSSAKESATKAVAPVVEFRTDNGSYLHYSQTFQVPSPYRVGQQVKIYYYIYKSRHEFALADDTAGSLPGKLLKFGLVFCCMGYPIVILRMLTLLA